MGATTLPDLIGYHDLKRLGFSRHRLSQLVKSGEFERVAPGVFVRQGLADDTTQAWVAIAAKNPSATLCLLTALTLHDLTDEIPARSDVAIPRGKQPVTVYHAPITWHRFDPATFNIGRSLYPLPAGQSIGIYSAERTLIDLFRLSYVWGTDLALSSLKEWLYTRHNNPSQLLLMAESFPKVHPVIQRALEVLL